MSEWKEYKLGDCVEMQKGFAFKSSDYINHGIKIIKVSNLNQYRFDDNSCVFISPILAEQFSRYSLVEDDIIISTVGSWPTNPESVVGKVCRVPKIINGSLLNQNAVRLRVKQNFNQRFLYYILSGSKFSSFIANTAQGSANQASITLEDIRSYEFISPSIKGQEEIVSILKSLDDKIEVNKKICENLEAQAQALFKHWFIDFAPFKDGKFVESELGLIPEGWRVGNIYEYIDVIYGAPYKSSLFNDKKNGLPLIRIRDLKTYSPQFYTPEVLPTTEYIEAGDVVAGMDAEFIPYLWLGEKGVLNQRCCKFKGKDNRISNYYILFLVKPELEYVQSYKTGTTVSHLGKSDIDRFRFVTPPLDVILSFSDMVNSMKEEVVTRAKESSRLATLRDTLLPKLMSGQIKVNEYE